MKTTSSILPGTIVSQKKPRKPSLISDFKRRPFPAHRGPKGEKRKGVIGKTETGRILVVILEKTAEGFRVITARAATASEKRSYRR